MRPGIVQRSSGRECGQSIKQDWGDFDRMLKKKEFKGGQRRERTVAKTVDWIEW